MNLEKNKLAFLKTIGGWKGKNAEEKALAHAVNASVKRGYLYSNQPPDSAARRDDFKDYWKGELREIAAQYKKRGYDEKAHVRNIRKIASGIPRKHKEILADGKMRIGTSQKALNLYLKFLWCLGRIPEPPHCPMDRIVLQAAGINGNWTELDSISEYKKWTAGCRKAADGDSLSVWELSVWN